MSTPTATRPARGEVPRPTREAGPSEPGGPWRGRLPSRQRAFIAFLHLAALWGLAVAQPLFEVLAPNPELFAARGMQGLEVVAVAFLFAAGPPVVLLALEVVAGAVLPPLRTALHLVFVGCLVGVLALQVLKRAGDMEWVPVIFLGALAGAVAAVAYTRLRGVRVFLTALSPAPLVFIALFLASGPVSQLVLAGTGEARPSEVSARAPVVLVLFDELPLTSLLDERGRIDARRYPNFAALAATSTWFRNTAGSHDRTSKAVPAVLTGNAPDRGQLPIADHHPHSLFTLLGGGYAMNVHEEATSVCPEDLCPDGEGGFVRTVHSLSRDAAVVLGHVVLPEDISARLPSVSEGWEGFADEDGAPASRDDSARRRSTRRDLARGLTHGLRGGRSVHFDEFVASLGEVQRERSLSFQQVFFPHAPFEYLPSGRRYHRGYEEPIDGLVPPSGTKPLADKFAADQLYARHLLQAMYTDRLLGRVIGQLRKRGLFDRSLLVVGADHGAAFRVGRDRRTVTRDTFADIASVPLLVKAPGQRRPDVRDAPVQNTDIVPTIADLLNVRLPWPVDGRSAFDRTVTRRRTVTMVQGEARRARIGTGASDRPVTVTTAELERQQRATLAHKLSLFGPRSDPFSHGPHSELRGRELAGLPVERSDPTGIRVELREAGELAAVDPRSGFVPAHLTGAVHGPAPRKRALAIAVNGRVAAVAETFFLDEDRRELLSAIVPEDAFRQGSNLIEILEVKGSGPRLRLNSLARFGGR